jgi:trans-L-3-hydroxyproline dehydratase
VKAVPAREPETAFTLELPCGLVPVTCRVEGSRVVETAFESVPAFLAHRDLSVAVEGFGTVLVDIAYGGAFYALLPASRLGLDFTATPLDALTRAAVAVTEAVRATVPIRHPSEPDLAFLYGTILTDDSAPPEPTSNLCVFAEGQVDRSPTGSGVTARIARDHARGLMPVDGPARIFRGPTGLSFTGRVARSVGDGVTVRVAGRSAFTGESTFRIESDDPLAHGFALPQTFGSLTGLGPEHIASRRP